MPDEEAVSVKLGDTEMSNDKLKTRTGLLFDVLGFHQAVADPAHLLRGRHPIGQLGDAAPLNSCPAVPEFHLHLNVIPKTAWVEIFLSSGLPHTSSDLTPPTVEISPQTTPQ